MAPKAPVASKVCKRCGLDKPLINYTTSKKSKDGRATMCRPCSSAYVIELRRLGRAKRPPIAVTRDKHLQRQYGLTLADYEAMFEAQGGLCAICVKPESQNKLLSVDHCHTTGRIRGLLCMHCNTGIGKLGDTPAGLRAALAYLEK